MDIILTGITWFIVGYIVGAICNGSDDECYCDDITCDCDEYDEDSDFDRDSESSDNEIKSEVPGIGESGQ